MPKTLAQIEAAFIQAKEAHRAAQTPQSKAAYEKAKALVQAARQDVRDRLPGDAHTAIERSFATPHVKGA